MSHIRHFSPDFRRRHARNLFPAATALSRLPRSSAFAADGDASNEALLKKMEQMEQRIQTLEAELKEKRAASPAKTAATADKPVKTTTASAAAPPPSKSDTTSPKNGSATADAPPDPGAAKKDVAATKL